VVWNAGDSAWSVNLSTGQGWTGASWPAELTSVPTLKSFYVATAPVHSSDPVILGYAVDAPPDCKLTVDIIATDANGNGIGTSTSIPNAPPSGTDSMSGYSYPAYFRLQAECLPSSPCDQPGFTLPGPVLTVPGPPVLKIASFSGSGVGTQISATAPNPLDVPVGTSIKLSWNVTDCTAGCAIKLQGFELPNAVPFMQLTGLPASGSWTGPTRDTNDAYVLTATDSTDPSVTAKLPVNLTIPAQTQCAGCQWFYFEIVSSPGSITSECKTLATYQLNLSAAQAYVNGMYPSDSYTVTQITVADYWSMDTCSP
jgi:hypothetical protein